MDRTVRVYSYAELLATDFCPACGKPVLPADAEVYTRLAPGSTIENTTILDRSVFHRSCLPYSSSYRHTNDNDPTI